MNVPSIYFPAHRNRFVLGVALGWVAWLLLFFSYAYRERLRIGHWPYFMDPQTMGAPRFPTHDAFVGIGLLAVFAVAVVWSVAVFVQAVATRPHRPLHALAALLIGWLPLLLGVLLAPSGLFEWFFD